MWIKNWLVHNLASDSYRNGMEAMWAASDDPAGMWRLLMDVERHVGGQKKLFLRKKMLLAAALCREVWNHMVDSRSRDAVDAAERVADGLIPLSAMGYAQTLAVFAADFNNRTPEERNSHDRRVAAQLAFWCVSRHNMIAYPFHGILPSPYSNSRVTEIIRQIFGNLFQPPEENQIWLKNKELWMTEDVIHTAASIYATRANPLNDVGILADALDDTGDAAEWLTSHMRLPGPHYRGCWYIDILLGKHDA